LASASKEDLRRVQLFSTVHPATKEKRRGSKRYSCLVLILDSAEGKRKKREKGEDLEPIQKKKKRESGNAAHPHSRGEKRNGKRVTRRSNRPKEGKKKKL